MTRLIARALQFFPVFALAACRVLTSGTSSALVPQDSIDADTRADSSSAEAVSETQTAIAVEEPQGVRGKAEVVGCADGTREGFRDVPNWPNIAGCAGGFQRAGVIGTPDLLPVCGRIAGDSSSNPTGEGCSAADLCALGWHICRDGADVARNSPTGDCEGCVPAGEPRFFVVASGATVGILTDPNDDSSRPRSPATPARSDASASLDGQTSDLDSGQEFYGIATWDTNQAADDAGPLDAPENDSATADPSTDADAATNPDAQPGLGAWSDPNAASVGICAPVPSATNDLHGCGGLGLPESSACAPLSRRMGFADCAATAGVWKCGGANDRLREAQVVTKAGPSKGGVLCCRR